MRKCLTGLAALAAVVAAAVIVPVATADPTHAKGATQVTAMCPGATVTVVVNGNGVFTPAHVISSTSPTIRTTSVFIPTAFDLTFTFTPSDGSAPSSEENTASKAATISNTVTCTIPLQTLFSGPEGTATIEGTVTGFYTPR
jgi:hypothetical protein